MITVTVSEVGGQIHDVPVVSMEAYDAMYDSGIISYASEGDSFRIYSAHVISAVARGITNVRKQGVEKTAERGFRGVAGAVAKALS
jgi:hypothetical protein